MLRCCDWRPDGPLVGPAGLHYARLEFMGKRCLASMTAAVHVQDSLQLLCARARARACVCVCGGGSVAGRMMLIGQAGVVGAAVLSDHITGFGLWLMPTTTVPSGPAAAAACTGTCVRGQGMGGMLTWCVI